VGGSRCRGEEYREVLQFIECWESGAHYAMTSQRRQKERPPGFYIRSGRQKNPVFFFFFFFLVRAKRLGLNTVPFGHAERTEAPASFHLKITAFKCSSAHGTSKPRRGEQLGRSRSVRTRSEAA